MASNIEVDRPPVAPGEIDQFTPRRNPSVWLRLRRNPGAMIGLVLIVFLVAMALTANLLRPEGYDNQNLRDGLLPPGGAYVLGTDELGRDLISRIVYGARISLQVGIIATVISAFVGICLGAVAGYMGGKVDYLIQAMVDISWAFPTVLMAIFMVAVLGPGLINVMIAVLGRLRARCARPDSEPARVGFRDGGPLPGGQPLPHHHAPHAAQRHCAGHCHVVVDDGRCHPDRGDA